MAQHLRNHLGFKLTDQEFENIPYPNLELGLHITRKTFQASCVILVGVATVSCAIRPYSGLSRMQSIRQRISKSGLRWMVIGSALGPAMTAAKVKGSNLTEDAVVDRCYRIRHNRGQVRVDRGEDLGLVAGVVATSMMGHGWILGAVLGAAGGVLTTAVLNATVYAKPPKEQ